MSTVLHLLPRREWDALPAGSPVRPDSLRSEGFVHCTDDLDVVVQVANAFYRDDAGEFVVLDVDTDLLTSECVWEAPAHVRPTDQHLAALFPHVYGPIDRVAITRVRTMRRDPDGAFRGTVD